MTTEELKELIGQKVLYPNADWSRWGGYYTVHHMEAVLLVAGTTTSVVHREGENPISVDNCDLLPRDVPEGERFAKLNSYAKVTCRDRDAFCCEEYPYFLSPYI